MNNEIQLPKLSQADLISLQRNLGYQVTEAVQRLKSQGDNESLIRLISVAVQYTAAYNSLDFATRLEELINE